jgi:serine protease Do
LYPTFQPASRRRADDLPGPDRRRSGALRWLGTLPAVAVLFWATLVLARPAPESFADLAERLLPAVVNVSTTQSVSRPGRGEEFDEFFRDFFDRQNRENQPRRATSLGSGFVIDPSGYIVTNHHVIAEAEEIRVRFYDGKELEAKVVGRDDKTDLALLKVEPSSPLAAVTWGDSDAVRVGDWILAIGNPFGLGGSVTAGILSARQRNINAGPYDDFLQTDASINRGNSGGPMFNMDGEVIGINTAIFSPSGGSIGIGFAIPSALARNVIEQIRQYGHPRRGWLGVRIQTVTEELAEGLRLPSVTGALVANVTEKGPAEVAGIKQGDVILRFDGRLVDDMRKLPRMVAETPIDKEVDVVVWRDGREQTFKVKLGELEEVEAAAIETPEPTPETRESRLAILGLSLSEITPDLRRRFGLNDETTGVVITTVDEKGAAAEKGLQVGDVIVEVDQHAVSNPAEVGDLIKQAQANGYRVVTLLVYREGDFQWVALRIDRG